MKRRLLTQLPRFSEQFGLTPDVFWSLTWDEYRAYMDHIEQTDKAADHGG